MRLDWPSSRAALAIAADKISLTRKRVASLPRLGRRLSRLPPLSPARFTAPGAKAHISTPTDFAQRNGLANTRCIFVPPEPSQPLYQSRESGSLTARTTRIYLRKPPHASNPLPTAYTATRREAVLLARLTAMSSLPAAREFTPALLSREQHRSIAMTPSTRQSAQVTRAAPLIISIDITVGF